MINPHLREAFLRQKLRREIKKAKRTSRVINESNLYTTFVEPFTDVFQAINLGAQDFLNSYITYLRLWITWNPEKAKQLLADHDRRRAEIAEKWKPLMEKTDKALSSGDADIIALAYAPQVWALSAVGAAAAEYGGSVAETLKTSGLGALVPFSDDMSNYQPEDKESGILDKLTTLFFGAAVAGGAAQGYLDSQKKQTSKNESLLRENVADDFAEDLDKSLQATGIKDELSLVGDDLFKLMKTDVKKLEDIFDRKSQLFIKIKEAETFEQFISGIQEASSDQSENESLDDVDTEKIKNELKSSVEKMVNSKDFVEKAKELAGKEEVSEQEIKDLAEKTAFLNSKNSIEKEFGGFDTAVEKLRSDIGDQIQVLLPTKFGLDTLKKGKATEVVDFVEKTKQKFKI